MADTWRLILLLTPLIAGAISIFFSYRLMKRYTLPFVWSYFYYMVFLYIFGTYSLAGAGIVQHLLARMDVDQTVIHSAGLFAIFLGIPFLALAKFMFLRSILDFINKKPAVPFLIIYFLSLTAAFVLYGIYMVRLNRFDLGDYQELLQIQRWVFGAFILTTYLSGFLYILISTTKLPDIPAKSYIRIFGSWYLAFMILNIIALALIPYHPFFRQLFLLIFLSWHLIPILFLNIYLNKYKREESALPDDFESRLKVFAAEHDISRRECDVIRLICQGLANQEISDSLYISLQTVKDHIHRIFVKTGVKNRVQLTNMLR